MAWSEANTQKAIDMYLEGEPTPENSSELVKQIAEEMDESPNGVRMVLVKAKVFVKKTPTTTEGATKSGDKPARVSKESQIAELRAAIESKGAEVDQEILDKLTGKAAAYFVKVLTA